MKKTIFTRLLGFSLAVSLAMSSPLSSVAYTFDEYSENNLFEADDPTDYELQDLDCPNVGDDPYNNTIDTEQADDNDLSVDSDIDEVTDQDNESKEIREDITSDDETSSDGTEEDVVWEDVVNDDTDGESGEALPSDNTIENTEETDTVNDEEEFEITGQSFSADLQNVAENELKSNDHAIVLQLPVGIGNMYMMEDGISARYLTSDGNIDSCVLPVEVDYRSKQISITVFENVYIKDVLSELLPHNDTYYYNMLINNEVIGNWNTQNDGSGEMLTDLLNDIYDDTLYDGETTYTFYSVLYKRYNMDFIVGNDHYQVVYATPMSQKDYSKYSTALSYARAANPKLNEMISTASDGYELKWYRNEAMTSEINMSQEDVYMGDYWESIVTVYGKWGKTASDSLWPIEKITVNYHMGKTPKSTTKKIVYSENDRDKSISDIFSKKGYTIEAWESDRGFTIDAQGSVDSILEYIMSYGVASSTLDLYVVWKPITYTISLTGIENAYDRSEVIIDSDDLPIEFEINYNETFDLAEHKYIKDGYTFKYWKATIDGKKKKYSSTDKLKNLTAVQGKKIEFSAIYTRNTYKLSFSLMGGKAKKIPSKYTVGNSIQLPVPVKKGYNFIGWDVYNKNGCITDLVNCDMTKNVMICDPNTPFYGDLGFVALYEENISKIVFYGSDGTPIENQPKGYDKIGYSTKVNFYRAAYEIGEDLDEDLEVVGFAAAPGKKTSYSLIKNYTFNKTAGSEIKLYPVIKKKKKEYSIKYNLDGGCLTKAVTGFNENSKTSLPKAVKKGYVFKGWIPEDSDDFVTKTVHREYEDYDEEEVYATAVRKGIDHDVSVTACFVPKFSKIYIVPNGSGVRDIEGKKYKSKTLGGFYRHTDEVVDAYDDDEDHDEYYDDDDYLDLPELERKGYEFVGFATSPKPKFAYQMDPSVYLYGKTGSITLYCIWTPETHGLYFGDAARVIYDDYEDTVYLSDYPDTDRFLSSKTLIYGKETKLPVIEVPGYTFMGWNLRYPDDSDIKVKKNKKGYVTAVKADNVAEVYVVAKLKENRFKLMLDPNGGTYTNEDKTSSKAFNLLDEYVYGKRDVFTINEALGNAKEHLNRPGYKLKGLYLDPYGTKPLSEYLAASKDKSTITIYAVWIKKG